MNSNKIKAMRITTDANTVQLAIAGRASYFFGLEPSLDDKDNPQGPKSYKTAILIPKDAPKSSINIIIQAIKDAVAIGINKRWGGVKPSDLRLPLRNGDEKAIDNPEKYAAYEGNWHLTAKKQEKQGPPILKAYGKKVETAGIIESGDWCVFNISLYPFSNKGKGVAVALNGVTLIEQGERFAGGPSESSMDEAADSLYGDSLANNVDSAMSGGGSDDLGSLLDDVGGDDDGLEALLG